MYTFAMHTFAMYTPAYFCKAYSAKVFRYCLRFLKKKVFVFEDCRENLMRIYPKHSKSLSILEKYLFWDTPMPALILTGIPCRGPLSSAGSRSSSLARCSASSIQPTIQLFSSVRSRACKGKLKLDYCFKLFTPPPPKKILIF